MGVAHGHIPLSRLSLHAIIFLACKCNCKNDLIDSSPIWFPTPNTMQKPLAPLCSKCFQLFLNFQLPDHGLRTQRELFFKNPKLGLGQTNWAEIFWGIWGIFGQTILALWVPCPWENVSGSFSTKNFFRSKTYNSQLWYWNSLHTSVYDVPDYSQSFEKTRPSNATPNILESIMKIYHFDRELIKCQSKRDDLRDGTRSENLSRQVVMRLLFCQNLGGRAPPAPVSAIPESMYGL